MTRWPEHIAGHTTHARKGRIANAFRYGVDYVLMDADSASGPSLFSRNRFNLFAVHDRDHGGSRGRGRGAAWAREVLAARGCALDARDTLLLLTQPRFLGKVFNPVSFWMVERDGDLIAVIAEVNNTFGDRHCYFCSKPGFAAIRPDDRIEADKIFHVSPFQTVSGSYRFGFVLGQDRLAISIDFRDGDEGLRATLSGPRRRLGNRSILGVMLRRPLGSVRTIALIHWQALRLVLKRAPYHPRPTPPVKDVSG
ncbi:DUF1365 domain-containing protein [Defluviimonas sp. WL0002]|uniref:DUF1365 domain-containing protein n=1 Tax=Albidovulum marisflavi TaxID=2984159 RepID=A0ABT2ZGJ5_9RHOB|nr:DUF1365 domain-containing protein [Defluviimonas sp. WL0002]MCV2870263.1 DUF1365 domain-containing protein [Defluviimonas sp. WL0002]